MIGFAKGAQVEYISVFPNDANIKSPIAKNLEIFRMLRSN
jgi:hypothetical protein